ncbi:hypothetical protein ACQPZX_06740 [Actinoplanes sp. CA-142083]|uniref:hypothetical protein n=1 Tax=Actinoplanes sp. CA-142083 TaxID=3239903 RepID=UPI003D8CAF3A
MRLVLVLACLLLAGCGPAGVSPSVVLSASPAVSSPAGDPPGSLACARLSAAMDAGSFLTAGVVDEIVAGTADADAPLADAAGRLGDAYRAAIAASGKADEPDKVAAVGAAASDMSDVCVASGLRTAG